VAFIVVARFDRSFWKYRHHDRAYAVLLMEAGHLAQTFYLVCSRLDLGAYLTAAINTADIDDRLGLDGITGGTLALCGCGTRAAASGSLEYAFVEYIPRETHLSSGSRSRIED
jgi:SagB-type dehydrogenase family enzyme